MHRVDEVLNLAPGRIRLVGAAGAAYAALRASTEIRLGIGVHPAVTPAPEEVLTIAPAPC